MVNISDSREKVAKHTTTLLGGWRELERRDRPAVHRGLICAVGVECAVLLICAVYAAVVSKYDSYAWFGWLLTASEALFLLYFSCDAVFNENTVLLAVFNASSLLLTSRLWFMFATEMPHSESGGKVEAYASLAIATVAQTVYPFLSVAVANDFGRKAFFRVGAKASILNLYRKFQLWVAFLKADGCASLVFLIVVVFFFEWPLWGRVGITVFIVAELLFSVPAVTWMEREQAVPLWVFLCASLVCPVVAVAAMARLDSNWDALERDYHHHLHPSSNTTDVDGGEPALILVNSLVVICICVRFGMIYAALMAMRGFGQGLYKALRRQAEGVKPSGTKRVLPDEFTVFSAARDQCSAMCDEHCRLSGHHRFNHPDPCSHDSFDYYVRRSLDPLDERNYPVHTPTVDMSNPLRNAAGSREGKKLNQHLPLPVRVPRVQRPHTGPSDTSSSASPPAYLGPFSADGEEPEDETVVISTARVMLL